LSASLRKMVALHWGQRIHSPSGTPRFGRPTVAMLPQPCSLGWCASPARIPAGPRSVVPLSQPGRWNWSRRFPVVDLGQRRERPAFQVFQERAATGGDVGHFLREAKFFDGLGGLAATDDRDRFRSHKRLGHGARTAAERY